MGNDTDTEDDPLTAVLVSDATNGILNLNLDGFFTYTPNANFYGNDNFSYKANDGLDDGDMATVTITIDPINDSPVAVIDGYNTDENTLLNISVPGVLENDTDTENDAGILVTPGFQVFFTGRNKIALNVDVFLPEHEDADSEYSIKVQSYLHF